MTTAQQVDTGKAGHRSDGDRPGRQTPPTPTSPHHEATGVIPMIPEPSRGNDLQTRILSSFVRRIVAARSYSSRLAELDAVAALAADHVRAGHIDRNDAVIALVSVALANGISDTKAGPIVGRHLLPKPTVRTIKHRLGA